MKLKRPKKKSKLFALDTEDNGKGDAFLFNFYDIEEETHHTFVDRLDALDYVLSHPNRTYWAVNLEYDINNLFRGHFALLKYIYAGSRLITAETEKDNIKFLDTLNHWIYSVKKMGDRIGLPKLEMDHSKRAPSRKLLKKELNENFLP